MISHNLIYISLSSQFEAILGCNDKNKDKAKGNKTYQN